MTLVEVRLKNLFFTLAISFLISVIDNTVNHHLNFFTTFIFICFNINIFLVLYTVHHSLLNILVTFLLGSSSTNYKPLIFLSNFNFFLLTGM